MKYPASKLFTRSFEIEKIMTNPVVVSKLVGTWPTVRIVLQIKNAGQTRFSFFGCLNNPYHSCKKCKMYDFTLYGLIKKKHHAIGILVPAPEIMQWNQPTRFVWTAQCVLTKNWILEINLNLHWLKTKMVGTSKTYISRHMVISWCVFLVVEKKQLQCPLTNQKLSTPIQPSI